MNEIKVGDYVKVYAPQKYVSSNGTVWATWSNTSENYYILNGSIAKVIGLDHGYGCILDMLPNTIIGHTWLTKIDYKTMMFKKTLEEL